MKLTENLSLKTPDKIDSYNVDDFNYNAQKLDTVINDIQTQLDDMQTIPTKTSDLTNDSNFTTLTDVQAAITAAINDIVGGSY